MAGKKDDTVPSLPLCLISGSVHLSAGYFRRLGPPQRLL